MSRLSIDSNVDLNDDTTPSWADGAAVIEPDDIGPERTFSRKRSLECSAVEVSIVGTEATQGHTLYIIQVSSGIKQWEVARRYRDFTYLDKQLRKNFPKLKIPALPPKRYLFSSTEQSVVDERKNHLETYLKSLMYIQSIWTKNDLVLFLNNETNSMMFIWNFERMRKMQDMLSSMSVENQVETSKLTTDLTLARTQVQALQERLSRMEMLLLQQATGMASEELSPSAIRSLSGMGMDRNLAQRLANEIDEESSHLYGDSAPSPARKGTSGEPHYGAPSSASEEEAVNPLDHEIIEEAINAHVSSGEALPAAEVVQVLSMATQQTTPAQSKSMLKNLKGKTPEQVRTLAVSLQLQEALRISNEVLNEKFDMNGLEPSKRVDSHADLTKLNIKTPAAVTLSAGETALFAHKAGATSGWVSVLSSEVDEIVQVLVPTEASIQARHKVFRYVRDLVSNTLGVQLFPIGSLVSQTYLPDGDIDASAFVCKNDDDSWFVRVNEALCMSSFGSASGHPGSKHSSFDTIPDPPDMVDVPAEDISISNVGFVNGDVKKIKIMINNIAVDISMNQIGSLYAQYLIEAVDKFVGQAHLFKKSMLLVEAWCRYESPRHTQGGGSMVSTGANNTGARLSAWAVTVMLIWVFNREGARIACPVQALGHFLRIFACFDWSKHALTVKGPVNAVDLSADESVSGERFFPANMLEKFSQVEDEAAAANSNAAASAVVPEAPEESIMIGEVVVKIDTSLKVEDNQATFDASGKVPSPVAAAPAAAPTEEAAPVDAPPAPLTKTNSSMITGMVTEKDAVYHQTLINIIDPAGPNRNLVVAMDVEGYQVITSALYEGYKHFQTLCDSFVKLQTQHGEQKLPEQEVTKVLKAFLINTQLKVIGWNVNFKRKPGNLSLAFGSAPETPAADVSNPNVDTLQAQSAELEFSLRYAEIVLGGRIQRATLIQLIIRILMHKGPMPVGEVGKNLQTMTGSENLSRRLKEQFNGLKKAIEYSTSPRLKVGTEHPFNPIVQLVPNTADEETVSDHPAPALAHHAYVFTPILAQAALLAREKEANANAANVSSNSSVMSGRSNRSFRRQAPSYMDNMSVSSRSNWTDPRNAIRKGPTRPKNAASPRNGNNGMGGMGGMNMYGNGSGNSSPMTQQYARTAVPMMMPQQGIPGPFPGGMQMSMGVPVQMQMGSPLQQGMPLPVYTQQMQQMQLHYMQQQQQMYQNYQAQMHPSMANSLSSSYGAHSPMAHSPMGGSMGSYQNYMGTMMGAMQQQQQAQMQGQQMQGHQGGMNEMSQHPQQTSPKNVAGQPQKW